MAETKKANTSLFLYLLFFISIAIGCQKKKVNSISKISSLSSTLNEISGIVLLSNDKLYAINDSGNSNTLFCMDQKGLILNKIKIPNSINIDWEDLAYDHKNTIYIGDFGNNKNDRKDLKIYKVSGIVSNKISVTEINFNFEDQKKFPPGKKNLNFDIEAFIYLHGNLYLFTKDRSKRKMKKTKLYKIPAIAGNYTAKLIGELETGEDPSDCLITAAAINKKQDKVVLLTHNKLFLLFNFKNDNLLGGDIAKIKLHHYSQKEGVCFKNDSTIFITDENTGHKKATLYKFSL